MKVHGDFRQEVTIDPMDVLENLLGKVRGHYQNWIFERDGEYFRGWEQSAGVHSIDMEDPITKEQYDFYQNVKSVMEYLKSKEE